MQSRIDGAPTGPAVGALENGTARPRLRKGISRGACVESGGSPWVDRQGADEEACQSRVDGAPTGPRVGCLEDPTTVTVVSRVQGGWRLGVDGQGQDVGNVIGQSRVDGGPTGPAVGALEDAADATRVEGGGGLGVDRQGAATACGVQPSADGAPAGPAVGALEDAAGDRVQGGGGLGIDSQGIDPD